MAKRSHNKFIKAKSREKKQKKTYCERKWSGNKKTHSFPFIFHTKCDGPSQRSVSICPSRDVVWLSSFYFTIDQITIFLRSCWIHSPWPVVCAHFYKYLIFLQIWLQHKTTLSDPVCFSGANQACNVLDLCVCVCGAEKKLCMSTWVPIKLHDGDDDDDDKRCGLIETFNTQATCFLRV